MNKAHIFRLLGLTVAVWIAGAVLAWVLFEPGAPLVGAKSGRQAAFVAQDFSPPNLQASSAVLIEKAIWGLQRDGSVRQKAAPEKENQKIEWRVLAATKRGKERHLVVLLDKTRLEYIKEGDSLPDGSVLKSISLDAYVLQAPGNEPITHHLTFR